MINNRILARLESWSEGKAMPPERVLIYPTNRCNLKCVFCYQRLNPYNVKEDLPKKRWLEITEELCNMGVDILQISGGGEPLLVKDTTIEMMKIIKRHRKTGRLVNNGTLWTEKIIEETIKMRWDNVIFSLDGDTPQINDFHRGVKGTFKKIIFAIKKFDELKKKYRTDTPQLELSSVLTNKNYKRTTKLIHLASKIGIKVITFEPVFISNPFGLKLKLNLKQREEFIKKHIPKSLDLAKKLNIMTNLETLIDLKTIEKTGNLKKEILRKKALAEKIFLRISQKITPHRKRSKKTNYNSAEPESEKKLEKKSKNHFDNTDFLSYKQKKFVNSICYEPWLWPKIEANGDVGACSSNIIPGANVRNRNFKEIWQGKEFNEFRKKFLNNEIPDGCKNCVSTHLPLNKRMRIELLKHLAQKNG